VNQRIKSEKTTDHSFGKILTLGNGKWSTAILYHWLTIGLCFAIGGIIFLFEAADRGSTLGEMRANISQETNENKKIELKEAIARKETKDVIFLLAGVPIFIILLPVAGAIGQRRIASTYIEVCENGISGKGVIKKKRGPFIILRRSNFQFEYNEVRRVDIDGYFSGTSIIVHTSETQYTCYCRNPSEIRETIVNQQQKVAHQAS